MKYSAARRPEYVTIKKVSGAADLAHISTSLVERQNLTIRMSMRCFTRLTNAFSKKMENLTAAVSLHFMFCNFARPHQTLTKRAGGIRTTPAMAAGVAVAVPIGLATSPQKRLVMQFTRRCHEPLRYGLPWHVTDYH